jgi:hypothetical protein
MLVTVERGGSLVRRGVKTPLGYRLSDRRLQKQTETDVRDGSKKISSKEVGSALGKVATGGSTLDHAKVIRAGTALKTKQKRVIEKPNMTDEHAKSLGKFEAI